MFVGQNVHCVRTAQGYLSICLSVYLRKIPCEKEPDPADSVVNVLREWPFFLPAELSSLSLSLLVFKMRNTDSGLVLGSVLRSKGSNNFLRESYSGKQKPGNMQV